MYRDRDGEVVREKIIKTLKTHVNQPISGEKLSEQLGVSRTAIWKNINILKEEGYQIESIPRKGYILRQAPDLLTKVEIQNGLQTKIIGEEIIHFHSIPSTNDSAKEFASNKAKEGLVITAEQQSAGRGRRGRTWESPKGTGIWMSILLRPNIPPSQAPKFTLLAAVAVASAIKEVSKVDVKIKWPNDLIINNKKVCGILTEMSAEMDFINYIIVGIGVNVNAMSRDFPEELQKTAISLAQVLGEKIPRQKLSRKILENIETRYLAFIETMDFEEILQEWRVASYTLGKQVKTTWNGEEMIAMAEDINEDGALMLRTDQDKLIEISFGDVMVRGTNGYV